MSAFEVQSQSVFGQYSQIALTSADTYFPTFAAKHDQNTPRLPIDAGRLILAPSQALSIGGDFLTTSADGGRGSEVDITGGAFDIVSTDGSGNGAAARRSPAAIPCADSRARTASRNPAASALPPCSAAAR